MASAPLIIRCRGRIIEEGAVEQLARAGFNLDGLACRKRRIRERSERSKHATRGGGHRSEAQLNADYDCQRSLAADQKLQQVRFVCVLMDPVSGGFLAHILVVRRVAGIAGHDGRVGLAQKTPDGLDPTRRLLTSRDRRAIAVAEYAVECVHPHPHRTVAETARSRSIGRYHSAKGAEAAARWINGQSKAAPSQRDIQCRPQHTRLRPDRLRLLVNPSHVIETGEVDDHAAPHGSARHAAARPARNERGASSGGPFHQRRHVFDICRYRHRGGHRPRYARRLGVDRPSEIVVAKDSPEARGHYSQTLVTRAGRRHSPRLLARGGFEE